MTAPSAKARSRKPGWFVVFLSGVFVLWIIFFAWLAIGWFAGGKDQAPELFVDTAAREKAAKVRQAMAEFEAAQNHPEEALQAAEEFMRLFSQGRIDETRTAKDFSAPRQLLALLKRIHDEEGDKVQFSWALNATSTGAFHVRFSSADFPSLQRLRERYTGYLFHGYLAFIREDGVMKASRFTVTIDN